MSDRIEVRGHTDDRVVRAAKAYEEAFNGPSGWTSARDKAKLLGWMQTALADALDETDLALRVAQEECDAWKLEAEEAREVARQVKAEVMREDPPTMSRIASMMNRIVPGEDFPAKPSLEDGDRQ